MASTSLFWIEPYIKYLLIPLEESKLGITWCETSLDLSKSKPSPSKNYSYKLLVPYAKETLVWEISFNPLYPELGPEIIIDGEELTEAEDSKKLLSILPDLIRWDPLKCISFITILNEYLAFYKQKQVKLLKRHAEKLHSEYLLLQNSLDSHNLEILVINGLKQTEVKFVLKLIIDSSNISTTPNKFINSEVLLSINFYGSSFNRIVPELHLSPYIKTFFNNAESLHIPPRSESQNLVNYVNEIKKLFTIKVNSLLLSMEQRKNFIATLIVLQHEFILEYDFANYRQISLLFENCDNNFILNFTLPLCFPNETFCLTMHSIYHMTEQGKPFFKVIKNFPYSPRWESKRMVVKTLEHVINKEIKNFQKLSFKSCS